MARRSRPFLPTNVLLMALTLGGIALGFAIGFGVRELHPSKDALMWIGMPGELFVRLLKLMVLPLVVCSVISATASLEPKANGMISVVAFAYIVVTNVIACVIAIVLCLLIKPGGGGEYQYFGGGSEAVMQTQDIFADLIRNIIPNNIVQATFQMRRQKGTGDIAGADEVDERRMMSHLPNETDAFVETERTRTKRVVKSDSLNILGLILFCCLIGTAVSKVKDEAAVFIGFLSRATDVVTVLVGWLFWLAPVGACSLIAASTAAAQDIWVTLPSLGWFVLATCVGLVLHGLLVLPAILLVITKRNPFRYLLSVGRPVMIGFASKSTMVAIPEMLAACETNSIDSRLARFVIPVCVTLNADGGALYIASTVIFAAQFTGVGLDVGGVFIVGCLTAVTSLAIPSAPGASIMTLIIILSSLNIPINAITLIFAAEWLLEGLRTAVTVVSHTVCVAVTYRFCQKYLKRADTTDHSADGGQSTTGV